jgi:hypothetical protein
MGPADPIMVGARVDYTVDSSIPADVRGLAAEWCDHGPVLSEYLEGGNL